MFTCIGLASMADTQQFCRQQIFNIASGERVNTLEGHREEVLFIKLVAYKGANVLLTGSQDGTVVKWVMSDDWMYVPSRSNGGTSTLAALPVLALYIRSWGPIRNSLSSLLNAATRCAR